MNLHGIVAGAIATVNPLVTLTIYQSVGYTTDETGARSPSYTMTSLPGQIQALSGGDLRMMEGLNIQGQARRVYVNGTFDGVVRSAQKGGDIVATPDGRSWKITPVVEYWPDWTSFVMVLQDGTLPT